ncbi:hypothetical protein [Brevibacterium album]|uniref:phage terminase small subunit n=1 Tax=Brevibacterium album TaxID=417948 RepID=UPI0004224677|nr:hypothetical protein [Brevibacterium album]
MPSRSEERVGHARQAGGQDAGISTGTLRPVRWPAADRAWSKRAKELYKAAKESGQSDYYQQTDIARLRFLLDQITYYEGQPQRSAMMLQSITSELSNLLFSEGDRRRVRIELSKTDNSMQDAQIVAIDSYKKDLGM